jgi:hypothetical protein
MAQGGKRPGAGRKKAERPTNANVATRVLAQARAEQLWLSLIDLERRRLGINKTGELSVAAGSKAAGAVTEGDYQGRFSIIPLTNLLRYLEDRAYGRPVDTVNHLHDKPIEMNVNVSIAEIVRKVRERKEQYERSR